MGFMGQQYLSAPGISLLDHEEEQGGKAQSHSGWQGESVQGIHYTAHGCTRSPA